MKVASFNVNSVRARLPVVVEWLRQNGPDVLALQETKVQDADFPTEAFVEIGYHCVFRGQKSYNGVALLSPHAIENVDFGLPDEPHDEPRLVKACVKGVTIVNTYVPQGYLPDSDKFLYKLEWFERLGAYFQQRFQPTDPLLWVGDLNIAPQAIDVYDPEGLLGHVCFHPKVHEALAKVMGWGFTDVFRMLCPGPGQYTFWDYRAPNAFRRNLGWRLDHIMATAPLAQKCQRCEIDKGPRAAERPSDHTPVIADFDID
ncbi:MAG: exodeoxyribonuclease III [Sedimentisphaerales bacterium]|nr:exodeoxyribonuclease III [Sedimentisphaerales bacterium]